MNEPKMRTVDMTCNAIECQVVKTDVVEGAYSSGVAFGLDMHDAYPSMSVTMFGEGKEPLTAILTPSDVLGLLQIINEFGLALAARHASPANDTVQ